ncbi:MAG: autotransporter outer membrane beta-barrel domain-containing protein [Verrucomicrobia bacterium]|nr:autotransporter outer membrane beta-barrel domain-containing protein [Verrucomicrobiota bacterium]
MPEHGRFYFDAGQRRGRARGDLDVGRTTFNSDSGLVGYNGSINPNLVVGALFDYEDSTASLGSPGSKTEVESFLLGVRSAWRQEAWFLNGLVAYGYDDYVSKRPVVFPGTSAVAKSNARGNHWLADISGGRDFDAGLVTFSPFVGLLAGGWDASQFTETGAGVYNNSVRDQAARTLQSQAGLSIELNTRVGEIALRPHVRAAWLHEYSNNARPIDAAFGTIDYTITTRSPQRDSALLSAGLDVELSPRVLLYTDIATQTGDRTRTLSEWRAGVSIGF